MATVTIKTNLTNCTLSPTSVKSGNKTTLTLTANDGYEFTTTPTLVIADPFGGEDSHDFTISSDKLTATYDYDAGSYDDTTVNATATKKQQTTINIITNLTNCTIDKTSIPATGKSTITLTANDGYEFTTVPTLSYPDPFGDTSTDNFTISDDKLSATIDYTPSSTDDITVTGTATEKPKPKVINFDLTNVSDATVTPTSFTQGETVNITITAQSGYNFETNIPYIHYWDVAGSIVEKNFTLDETKTTGTFTFNSSEAMTDNEHYTVEIHGVATVITKSQPLYTIYIVNNDILDKVASKRFGDGGLNTFINDIYQLPLQLDTSTKQALYLYDTKIVDDVPIVKDRIIKKTLGTFRLPRHFNNANDYNNVYTIVLPYYGSIELDNEKYIDSDFTIDVTIDIVMGDTTYTFTREGQVIDSYDTNIKMMLPFLTADTTRISYFSKINLLEVAPTLTAYYHDVHDEYVTTSVTTTLNSGTYHGYLECELVTINVSNKYRDMINAKMKEGIIYDV